MGASHPLPGECPAPSETRTGSENFAAPWIERFPQMVRLRGGRNQDVCPGPMAARLREYRVSEKMSQLVEFLHVKIRRNR